MKHNHFLLSWCDLLLNLGIAFVAMFMLAVAMMAVTNKTHQVDLKAKAIIVMDWDGNSADDMDLWLKTPEPAYVGFNQPNGRIAHLERDDLGKGSNFFTDATGKHYQTLNREIITLREKMDGHYVINANFYGRHPDPETKFISNGPVTVTVQLIQIDPEYKELGTKQLALKDVGDEQTAFTFEIDDGNINNVRDDVQEPFVINRDDAQ